jgi:hypothetical protein
MLLGEYSFQRAVAPKQTVKITAGKRNDLRGMFSVAGAVYEVLNAVEGHRVTYVDTYDTEEGK